MEKFLEIVMDAERAANDFVWGPIMLALLVGTGVFLTFRTEIGRASCRERVERIV